MEQYELDRKQYEAETLDFADEGILSDQERQAELDAKDTLTTAEWVERIGNVKDNEMTKPHEKELDKAPVTADMER